MAPPVAPLLVARRLPHRFPSQARIEELTEELHAAREGGSKVVVEAEPKVVVKEKEVVVVVVGSRRRTRTFCGVVGVQAFVGA